METLARNLRFALRGLVRSPALSLVAVAALALGIGANTAIFSVLHGVLLTPLPYPQPERLVRLIDRAPELGFPRFSTSPPDFVDWRREATSFTDLVAISRTNASLAAAGGEPERLLGARVSAGFFEVLRVAPQLGRWFAAEEDQPGAGKVVVLGDGLWRRKFGADPGVVGRTVSLDGELHAVVGVAPASLTYPPDVELWLPLAMEITEGMRGGHFLQVLGRLADGVSLEQAQAEMDAITRRLAEAYPDTNTGWGVGIYRLQRLYVEQVETALWVLMATVGMVLLIACANVANVLLARIISRRRETAIRSALGAGRGRLVGLFLTESVLLALAGGLVGAVLAYWGTEVLLALSAGSILRSTEVGLSGEVLGFALLLSVGTGLLFGLLPALHASRADVRDSLAEGGRALSGGRGARLVRHLLVLAEVALAVLLLIGAGLLIRSFVGLREVSPGFTVEGVLTAKLSLPELRYGEEAQQAAFLRELDEALAALPGSPSTGIVFPLPLGGNGYILTYTVEGRPIPGPSEAPNANIRFVSPGYLDAVQIPLLQGRTLSRADDSGSQGVALINQTMARQMWPQQDPLGARFTFGDPTAEDAIWLTIVGVVGDVRASSLEVEPAAEIYRPLAQAPMSEVSVVLRGEGPPALLAGPLRHAVRQIDAELPLFDVVPLSEVVARTYSQQRFNAVLLGLFAAVALALAAIGVYGVVSYSVSQRAHEMGLRMALGAKAGNVLALVVRQSLWPVLAGLALGLLLAPFGSRALEGLLHGIGTLDLPTYVGVPLLLAATALFAILVPALRATRVDPMVALREE